MLSIHERLKFEELISQLSTEFINLPIAEVDKKISYGLKLMVEALQIDRSLLHEFSDDQKLLYLTHYYVKPGVKKPASKFTSRDNLI